MLKERYLKNIYLIKLKDLNYGMILCEETKTGRQWIITEKVFKRFKRSGFAVLPKELGDTIYDTFKNKNYKELSTIEKLEIIQTLLNLASKN